MIKYLYYYSSILLVLMASQYSLAATDIVNAKILDVAPDKDHGVIYVVFDSTQRGSTACVSSQNKNKYQINDLGTPISNALLSAALTALASGRLVKAVGNGTCNGRAGFETLRLLSFVH